MKTIRALLAVTSLCAIVSAARESAAWAEHEHARITAAAFASLAEDDKSVLHARFGEAFYGAVGGEAGPREGSLLELPQCRAESIEEPPTPGDDPTICLGIPWLPMLAGDHSCSAKELDEVVSTSPWAKAVLLSALTTETRVRLAQLGPGRLQLVERDRIRRDMDLELTAADQEYLSRASTTFAHYVEGRKSDEERLADFVSRVSVAGEDLNATTLYVYYHTLALAAARSVSSPGAGAGLASSMRSRRALLLESMALHFLEDSFAAGHVHGLIDARATRMGTHDYYSVHGYATRLWNGESLAINGDLHMRAEDRRAVSKAVSISLGELAGAFRGEGCLASADAAVADAALLASERELDGDEIDVCYDGTIDEAVSEVTRAANVFGCGRAALEASPRPAVLDGERRTRRASMGLGPVFIGEATGSLWWYNSEPVRAENPLPRADPGPFGLGNGVTLSLGLGINAAAAFTVAADPQAFIAGSLGMGLDHMRGERYIEAGLSLRIPYYVVPLDGLVLLPLSLLENASAIGAARMAFEESPLPIVGAVSHAISGRTVPGRIAYGHTGTRLSLEILRDISLRAVWTRPNGATGEPARPSYQIGTKVLRWRVAQSRMSRALLEATPYLGLALGTRPTDGAYPLPRISPIVGREYAGNYWQVTVGAEALTQVFVDD